MTIFFDEAVVVHRKILTRLSIEVNLRSICVESIVSGSYIRFYAYKNDFTYSLTYLKGY